MDKLFKAPADAGTSTSGGQQRPIGRKKSGSKYTSLGADVKCSRRQHQVLVTYIRHALQNWGPSDELPLSYWINVAQSPWEPSASMQLTPELKRVLTRAVTLSEDCCQYLPPLKATLRHAQRFEEFADILKEIHWCTSVVFHTVVCRELESNSAALRDFPWQAQLGYQEHLLLNNAVEEDWQQLQGELEDWKRDHACSAEDCGNLHLHRIPSSCLAGQVLRRLSPKALEGEQDHKSLLWSFDPDTVKHGRKLGSGAFGQVVQVKWLGSNYAQKIFSHAGLPTLRAEADALVKMNHPHIVKVHAYSEDSLLMDLMCMDLHKFIRSRMKRGARVQPFSLAAAIDLMLQIGEAVSYLHSQQMAHRDLKSMNILVNPLSGGAADDGFVFAKIADFGLAKIKREIIRYSQLTPNVGTRKWMAPEIFGANKEDDHHLEDAFPMKADVYSFGIVCSEILSGEEPFGDVPVTDLYSMLTAPFPLRPRLPSNCPTHLASLVCACWDADPRKRPAFVDVCRVLRYLKGVQVLTEVHESECLLIDRFWPFGRLTAEVQQQGPWGACDTDLWRSNDPVGDIKAFRVHFRDIEKLELGGFSFCVGEELLRDVRTVGEGEVSTDWICFDHPSEYLVQVEGSSPRPVNFLGFVSLVFLEGSFHLHFPRVSSLSFITTKKKYGPYGTPDGPTTLFCSDPGRVVDFDWRFDGWHLLSLAVSVIPDNIVGCLRKFLDEEDQSA